MGMVKGKVGSEAQADGFLVVRVLWATVCAVWEHSPVTEL